MDNDQAALVENLERLAAGVRAGTIHAVFAVAIGDDGPRQVVLVEPEQREPLITAINEEASRMLGSPHHLASAEKIQRFLMQHKISPLQLLAFEREEKQRGDLGAS